MLVIIDQFIQMADRTVQQIKAGAVVGWRGDLEKKAAEVRTMRVEILGLIALTGEIFTYEQVGDKWKPYQTLDQEVEAETKA